MASILNVDRIVDAAGTGTPMIPGHVVQVVSANSSQQITTSGTTYIDTNLTASITPSSSSNKILVMFSGSMYNDANGTHAALTVFRGNSSTGTNLDPNGASGIGFGSAYGNGTAIKANVVGFVLDSPSTTSSTTYTAAIRNDGTSSTIYLNVNQDAASLTLMEIAQ